MTIAPSKPELAILDVASEHTVARRHYYRDGFEGAWNLTSHDLPDVELIETIAQMENKGLIVPTHSGNSTESIVKIAEHGAATWESVRRPDWQTYLADLTSVPSSGFSETHLWSLNPELCWRYLHASFAFGRLSMSEIELTAEFSRGRLRFWHSESDIYNIKIKSATSDDTNIALEKWQANQFWWSSISELIQSPRHAHE